MREEGPAELYRGLTSSLIGVVPYAATNYFAYDALRKAYKEAFKKEEIGNIVTLLIGSAAGAISSSATFPLEVARKHMQAGALNGRQYQNMLHALASILEKEGLPGLYKGLGPSCIKLVPAAGISFMCYEACKKILIEKEESLISWREFLNENGQFWSSAHFLGRRKAKIFFVVICSFYWFWISLNKVKADRLRRLIGI